MLKCGAKGRAAIGDLLVSFVQMSPMDSGWFFLKRNFLITHVQRIIFFTKKHHLDASEQTIIPISMSNFQKVASFQVYQTSVLQPQALLQPHVPMVPLVQKQQNCLQNRRCIVLPEHNLSIMTNCDRVTMWNSKQTHNLNEIIHCISSTFNKGDWTSCCPPT